MLARILLNFALLTGIVPLSASASFETPQYTSRFWRTSDGLPHNSVRAIAQTTDGYLWIGTDSGLARFDGITFQGVDLSNSSYDDSVSVNVLCPGQHQSLWIGVSGRGLARLKNGTLSWFTPTNGLPRTAIRALFAASDGAIWIGMDRGFARFKEEKLEVFADLAPSGVNAFCEDGQQKICLATRQGIKRVNLENGASIENLFPADPDPEDPNEARFYTRALCFDNAGVLWAGVYRSLIRLGNDLSSRSITGFSHDFVSAIHQDRHGNHWVGTFGGLNQIPSGSSSVVDITNEGESFDTVHVLLEDREGNIWVGTNDGLARLRRKTFAIFDRRHGLSHNNVVSVIEDHRGRICIGTRGGGLNFLQDGHVLPRKETFEGDSLIMAMAQSGNGGMWLTAENVLKVFHYTEAGVRSYGDEFGYNQKYGRVIFQDRAGHVWIGTRAGLFCFDGNKINKYTTQNGLSANGIHDLLESRDGTLWIATERGLNRKEGKLFVGLPDSSEAPPSPPASIYEDAEGRLWLGTRKGLALFQNERFFFRPELPNPLFHENILGILEDNEGNLWMSSKSGIFSADKMELEEAFHGRLASVKTMAYDASDGLASVSFNDAAKPSCWKSRDERMWFATTKGLAMIDPKSARRPNRLPPPVAIERVIADRQPVTSLNHYTVKTAGEHPVSTEQQVNDLTMQPGKGELEIHYTALSFIAPEKIQFKYKLEGFDRDWIEAGTRRTAYYNNLTPGFYTFRVIACNNDGAWNETGASLALTLKPHFWQTHWFAGSLALVAIGFVGGTARYFTRKRMQRKLELLVQQNAIEKERSRIARDMHDDLGARLTGILLLSRLDEKKNGATSRAEFRLEKISSAVEEAVDNLHAIVWAVNPQNDTLDNLVTYIQQHAQSFFKPSAIRCRFDLPAPLPSSPLSAEVRHHIFMAVKEALNNIAKHACASEAWIRLRLEKNDVLITIEDNGAGFVPTETNLMGNGLKNMQRRMETIDGSFSLASQPGKGTRIELTLPIPNERLPAG